ncbi:MAG: hypothetical protein A3C11_01760 [Candidatus Sungbacteria bacterium RIFCSPHIGHO2_02_FULL_49_12]|uniref:Peptidase E n=1 Tax=Candidatus Sungbacteria bacterium RIFCSPHIGHO2_02_FULL_49_12 TaxID=1802271 RepID=A0A1G2KQ15_9BACT|nr:MAG: hypothetical protein A3C11_01760 [Candidatus Sungbacteria bacterium RIFCSPHIGHO2_02_FULL_49_12]
MRLILTSNGFHGESKNIRDEFFRLAGKSSQEIRVAFVPTASHVEKDRSYVEIDRGELINMGIPRENIVNFELDHGIDSKELQEFDVIFIEGGNTFFLLQKVRESGFDKAIKEYLDQDRGVYVGVSAGTILAGPNIEISEPWDDKSLAKLGDTVGLNLVAAAYCPHFRRKDESILSKLQGRASYSIKPLEDGQAVVSDGLTDRLITG